MNYVNFVFMFFAKFMQIIRLVRTSQGNMLEQALTSFLMTY